MFYQLKYSSLFLYELLATSLLSYKLMGGKIVNFTQRKGQDALAGLDAQIRDAMHVRLRHLPTVRLTQEAHAQHPVEVACNVDQSGSLVTLHIAMPDGLIYHHLCHSSYSYDRTGAATDVFGAIQEAFKNLPINGLAELTRLRPPTDASLNEQYELLKAYADGMADYIPKALTLKFNIQDSPKVIEALNKGLKSGLAIADEPSVIIDPAPYAERIAGSRTRDA